MLLGQDNVVPTVAEVVEIIEAARVRSECLMQHNSALVRLLQLVRSVWICRRVFRTVDRELM